MMTIAGALPVNHTVDPNGSLTVNVPLQLPHAKVMPEVSFAYHSASSSPSSLGLGWALKGAPIIERVSATTAQDKFRGVVKYDKDDRFALDGQRLVRIGSSNEHRFEIEQWSKLVPQGSDAANPDSWTQYMPDGTSRTFGTTSDSNIKALGQKFTRIWAISEMSDAFENYINFKYNNDSSNGSFYLNEMNYGGNKTLNMTHQRKVSFVYETRDDKITTYLGGYKIHIDKRLVSITSEVQSKLVHKYLLTYNTAPLTKTSRLQSLTLAEPSGAKLCPLVFSWVDANKAVYDDTTSIGTIAAGTSTPNIIPQDVHATGRSDIVLASSKYDSNLSANALFLDVHLSDGKGKVSAAAATGSGTTGLLYPTQLLPLDMNGDGRTDLVHILSSSADSKHSITVLLSTKDGYKKQTTLSFSPESMIGCFYSGDFEGNGHVGLVYVYQTIDNSSNYHLKFVQFRSDGTSFIAMDKCEGPMGQTFESTRIVVGDFNGNGMDDIFLISPNMVDSTRYCKIGFVESKSGVLTYRTDGPFESSASKVLFTDYTAFLPFNADNDGKTSLLVVSHDSDNYVQLQLIRSTGTTLLADSSPTSTKAIYSGNIILNKTASTRSIDLLNSYDSTEGPKLNFFRFDGEKFSVVENVLQPKNISQGSVVRWADLRGIGRTDCLLNTSDTSGNLKLSYMPCSTLQPIDYISSYHNGIGANVKIIYAPLSDPKTYSVGVGLTQYPKASLNSLARNVASGQALTAISTQNIARTRTELVHYPSFVVQQVTTCARASQVDVIEHLSFTYANARVSFDGRGWLGFGSISKTSQPVGVIETTSYRQDFPLLGQIAQTTSKELATGQLMQEKFFAWTFDGVNDKSSTTVRLLSSKEVFYEANAFAYDATASFAYDEYSNIISKTIETSQIGVAALSFESTFDNDTQHWAIGRKMTEVLKQNDLPIKQVKHTYVPKTRISNETSHWVSGSIWSTRTFEFDETGNEISAKGPQSAHQTFKYDDTYSNMISMSTYTSDSELLTETATYDLALGKPLTNTTINGLVKSYKYDILGRVLEISEGESSSSTTVIEKHFFNYTDGEGSSHTRLILSGRDANDANWSRYVVYTDGLQRTWKSMKSRADNLEKYICSATQYDGAGRVIARSRDFLDDSVPAFAVFTYDPRSRLIQEISPPDSSGPPITTTYHYAVISGLTVLTETRSNGADSANQVTIKTLSHLPNTQPSTGKLIIPFVTSQTNGLKHTIQTIFDGLGRPIQVIDPSDVKVTMIWDGLSRQIERCITSGTSEKTKTLSHFKVTFDDKLQTTLTNVLNGSKIITKSDFANRTMSKTTKEETLTFLYGTDTLASHGRLVRSSSTNKIDQEFTYNIRGHLTSSVLKIDGHVFGTSYDWTPAGELLKTTNPDKSTLTRTLLPDGQTPEKFILADCKNTTQASATFSDFANPVSRPLHCQLGNNISSQSTLSNSCSPTGNTLINSNNTKIFEQSWSIESFNRIHDYTVKKTENSSYHTKSSTFGYDAGGQLISGSDSSSSSTSASFAYDQSGNISSKDGNSFVNDGWQLFTIHKPDGTVECSFSYSADGCTMAQLDASGKTQSSMIYDSEGRLINLDGTIFVYDHGGRMIKSKTPAGNVTYYPTQTYETTVFVDGDVTQVSYLVHGYRRASFSTKIPKSGNNSSEVYYFHSDHIGSIVAVSNTSGKIITQYFYDSFGAVTTDGPDVSRYKFSGKEKFGDAYYFGSRFYNSKMGRFLTLDNFPLDLRKLTPSTFNMYTFSRNDPMNYVDMYGLVPLLHWIADALLIAVGVAVCFVPLPGMAFLGGAILGAGISGIMYDLNAQFTNKGETKDSDWFIQLGLGAAFGLISAGVGAALDLVLPAGSIVTAAVTRGASGALSRGVVSRLAVRAGVRLTAGAISGSGLGVLQQMATNGIDGEAWNKDLGTAAWTGAVAGVVCAGVFEARDFFVLKPSARLKFWTGKKWGVWDRTIIEYRGGENPFVRTNIPYPENVVGTSYTPHAEWSGPMIELEPLAPLAQSESSSIAGSTASLGTAQSGPSGFARRYMHSYDVTSV